MPTPETVRRSVRIEGPWRYWFARTWGDLSGEGVMPPPIFVMLNPSTADHETDDATIRSCTSFCKHWGANGFVVVNLFAFRARDPKDLAKACADDPWTAVGPRWEEFVRAAAQIAALQGCTAIAAWGATNHPPMRELRAAQIASVKMLFEKEDVALHCIGTTGAGHPRHPLYRSPERDFIRPWEDANV